MVFSSNIFLVITFLSIASLTLCSAQIRNTNVTLAGVITCPNTSLSSAGTFRVIPQAQVDVVCTSFFIPRVTKSAKTNFVGVYSLSFSQSDILFNNPELCYLNVTLPMNSCTFSPPGGAIRFPILAIRSPFGVVTYYFPGAPTYVRA
ncbi:hypothetical protein PHJA_002095100 [Phtheirospermum japonicum]|uniref:Pollen Ole e 1 allergen and extensin family protein n=1 Tax=Phtheirospermum japonicum TaxID=374723 RepID=A0A830CIE5_9LAMI|nr:hypothetical protein PHJA_002095100 [Phtheirospermum japonicum]